MPHRDIGGLLPNIIHKYIIGPFRVRSNDTVAFPML